MSVLQLDLNNLTPAHLAEAKPFCGRECRYAAPCIIGTIVPEDQRKALDRADFTDPDLEDTGIGTLMTHNFVALPANQRSDAENLQLAFDDGDWEAVERIAAPYILGKELAA